MTTERATVERMETDMRSREDGSYRQELDAWRRTTTPVDARAVYRCPWDRCPNLYHDRADLHRHLDIIHGGNAP